MIQGSFINLERSRERMTACMREVSNVDLTSYNRFSAVNGIKVSSDYPDSSYSPGKLGCWLSHLGVIKNSLEHTDHQHVLEDDFVFTDVFKFFVSNFDQLTIPEDWDIIFCDIDLANMHDVSNMGRLIHRVSSLEKANKIAFDEASSLYAAGNSSYIINNASKERIYSLMQEGFNFGLPNDLYLRKLIREGKVKAYVTLPFVTTVSDDFNESTILGNIAESNPSIVFATLFRRSLAWGADTRGLLQVFQQRINQLQPIGDRGMIYAQLVAHFVSQDYQNY